MLASQFRRFVRTEAAGGIILIVSASVALVIANTSFSDQAERILSHPLFLEAHSKTLTVRDWINDGLMALFFLSVGMEIRREISSGQLSTRVKASLPVIAAFGGMLFPAAIYLLFNGGGEASHGWGIPMATDIAFSLGVISLLGKRVPLGIKIFVTALAIADDLGAVLVIAFFYANDVRLPQLLFAVGTAALIYILKKWKLIPLSILLGCGVVLWYFILQSGVHPTIAGVILGLILPTEDHEKFRSGLSKIVAFAIMPLFALANAGILINGSQLSGIFSGPVSLGIFFGLLLGKSIGIFSFSLISKKLGLSVFPEGVTLRHILGASILCGIGFTMSLFIAQLAFPGGDAFYDQAKLAIIFASFCAAIIGFLFFHFLPREVSIKPKN
ncbi:MAG: Na+/H+ antiporter NhaA [Bacteroidota bacterium]|nr:Na+/H+ antiporter NhaA [Bacteroidota bacterium]